MLWRKYRGIRRPAKIHSKKIFARKELEIRFENDFVPDTEGVVFAAAAVEGEEVSDEIEELVDGNESMKYN